jgi:predicted  nucleic acid-binding Zn-ribbon protein
MPEYKDFQEIAHCGGKVTFHIACDAEGHRSYSQGFRHDRPTPAAWIGIYAWAPHAIPVADFRIGGEGQGFDPQPPENCFPVFLGSDSRQCWGHQCPRCKNYFRNGVHPAIYPLTCPYCGVRAAAHKFLTLAQRAYVKHYLDTLLEGLEADMNPGTEQSFMIDMDAVADRGASEPRPEFYYTAETQQTRYKCVQCGDFNDIRGRYGYCASCGWRNNLLMLKETFAGQREELNSGHTSAEVAVKSAVSAFDACCSDFAFQIAKRIPMKPSRKADLERLVFQDVESVTIANMKSMFDIDILEGLGSELSFVKMMMHRRHVFEHNAGVADHRYLKESGDPNAREGVLIRESQANAHRLISGLTGMAENFEKAFHEIFNPTQWPIDYHAQRTGSKG